MLIDNSIKNILSLKPKKKHMALKNLTSAEICWLYQENPFDEELELQSVLSSKHTYGQIMQDSINYILRRTLLKIDEHLAR